LFTTPVQQDQALAAGHGSRISGRNSLHFGPMRGFLIARVAQDHTIGIEAV
jgi:hypothetical protein